MRRECKECEKEENWKKKEEGMSQKEGGTDDEMEEDKKEEGRDGWKELGKKREK